MSKQIPLTQGKFTIVDDEDFDLLISIGKWRANKTGNTFYAKRSVWDKETKKKTTLLIHRIILRAKEGICIDHINHDGLDNRKVNLRICSISENAMNSIKRKT